MARTVYLDVDDEITTAVARIRGAPPGPVVIVVPFGSRLGSSRINFRLLAREAAALDRELVVVAPEPATRALATSAGLTTHATVMAFEAAVAAGERPGGSGAPGASSGAAAAASAAATAAAAPLPGSGQATAGATIRSGRPVRGGGAEPGGPAAPGWPAPDSRSAVDDRAGVTGSPGSAKGPGPAGAGGPGSAGHPPSLPVVGPRPGISRLKVGIALAVVAVLVLGGGAMAAVFLPSADITIQPATQPVGPLDLTVTADPAATAPDPGNLVVPATSLELPVEAAAEFAATGKRVIEEKATGAVTFQNCDTGGPHTFPAGTQVRTAEGVAFVTTASVRLDRAKINPAFACTSANANITAVSAGPEGNVVAGTITRLPAGYDTLVLSVVNRAPTSGGSRTEILRVVQADIDAALASLRTRLNDAFAAKLAEPGLAPPGSVLVANTQRLGEATASPDPSSLLNREQEKFELKLAATGTVIAVNPEPVSELATARLEAAVADGFRLVPGSGRTTVDPPAVSGGAVTFAVRVRAEQVREIDVEALAEQIRGRSIAAARSILEPYGTVRITVWPDWVTAIPSMDGRVRLVVAPASPAPGASPRGGTGPEDSGAPSSAPPGQGATPPASPRSSPTGAAPTSTKSR